MTKSIKIENNDITFAPEITRVEVIGNGREYVNNECENTQISLQDNGRTLKIFIK